MILASEQVFWYTVGMDNLTDQIRRRVETCGQTRYRIAQETGITEGHLSRFVRGQSGLSIEHAETLAKYLGLEIILRRKGRARKAVK